MTQVDQWNEHKLVVYEKIESVKEDVKEIKTDIKEEFRVMKKEFSDEVKGIHSALNAHIKDESVLLQAYGLDIKGLKIKNGLMWQIGYGLIGGGLTIFVAAMVKYFINK